MKHSLQLTRWWDGRERNEPSPGSGSWEREAFCKEERRTGVRRAGYWTLQRLNVRGVPSSLLCTAWKHSSLSVLIVWSHVGAAMLFQTFPPLRPEVLSFCNLRHPMLPTFIFKYEMIWGCLPAEVLYSSLACGDPTKLSDIKTTWLRSSRGFMGEIVFINSCLSSKV